MRRDGDQGLTQRVGVPAGEKAEGSLAKCG